MVLFQLAVNRHYAREADLQVELASGMGTAAIVSKGAYEIGYLDLSATIERTAKVTKSLIRESYVEIDAPMRHKLGSNAAINFCCSLDTLDIAMVHTEDKHSGIGDIDDQRFERMIERIVRVKRLRRTLRIDEVFNLRFLPPFDRNIRGFAASRS